jgi:hypothetical protein
MLMASETVFTVTQYNLTYALIAIKEGFNVGVLRVVSTNPVIFDNVSKNCVYLQNIHFLSRLHIDI